MYTFKQKESPCNYTYKRMRGKVCIIYDIEWASPPFQSPSLSEEEINTLDSFERGKIYAICWTKCYFTEQGSYRRISSHSYNFLLEDNRKEAIQLWKEATKDVKIISSHNAKNDWKYMLKNGFTSNDDDSRVYCTMHTAKHKVGIMGKRSVKPPSLNELYKYGFDSEFIHKHDAGDDGDQLLKCVRIMV